MSVYLPSAQFVITWTQIARIDVYCPATYVVNTTTLFPVIEFIDVSAPLQPGYIDVPVLDDDFQSNHVTIDHIIKRAWYITDTVVEHDWNDWQTEFYIDPISHEWTIRLAVYSFAQHAYAHTMPPIPADYWWKPPF